MYQGVTAPSLKPLEDARIALKSVIVEVAMENLLCEVTIRQVYRNLERNNIEAVYTFPMALDAVLLDLVIKTKERQLKGTVMEKSKAEDAYEEAITEGDTVIMLEQAQPGLYTMNVGNIQPDEEVEITLTYAELHRWKGSSLRFFLPTTIAPRYGDPESIGIQPHQAPEYDLLAENPYSITVTILGELAGASFESPSHPIKISGAPDKTIISLKKGSALMDRDFVLDIHMETGKKCFAVYDRDIDGHVAMASFFPNLPNPTESTPRLITIVVDCSGSMGGDSIAQARKALLEILELLRSQDSFNVVRFGSTSRLLFKMPVRADSSNLKKAKNLLEVLDADMGGTEIGQAVSATLQNAASAGIPGDVLLITDGEVWAWEKVAEAASGSGVRFFTVGVGSSVSEAFVRSLAEVTGGACELVSPREDMAERIVRHFKRIYAPRAQISAIHWPVAPVQESSFKVRTVFDGDTLHVFALFREIPEGTATLTVKIENGEAFSQEVEIRKASASGKPSELPGTLARMAAARQIRSMSDPKDIVDLAVRYQLMTSFTNYLAIDVRTDAEKARDLPALRKVPQMLAAGWGGAGTVMAVQDSMLAANKAVYAKRLARESMPQYSVISLDELKKRQLHRFINEMNNLHSKTPGQTLEISSIQDIENLGAPQECIEELRVLKQSGVDEYEIVVLFLYILFRKSPYKNAMLRSLKRAISKAYKQLSQADKETTQRIEVMLL